MTGSCPIPTPAERRFGEVLERVQKKMIQNVFAALDEATEQMRKEFQTTEFSPSYEPEGHLAATMLQKLYCRTCHADPDTFAGGDPRIASAIIRNCQNIARHYSGRRP